jgi:hypothetical protein
MNSTQRLTLLTLSVIVVGCTAKPLSPDELVSTRVCKGVASPDESTKVEIEMALFEYPKSTLVTCQIKSKEFDLGSTGSFTGDENKTGPVCSIPNGFTKDSRGWWDFGYLDNENFVTIYVGGNNGVIHLKCVEQ